MAPRPVRLYQAYCIGSGLFNILLAVLFRLLLRYALELQGIALDTSALEIFFIVTGCLFALLTWSLLLLPRQPWTYRIHEGNLVAGVATIVLLPLALPLLRAWRTDEVRAYFAGAA